PRTSNGWATMPPTLPRPSTTSSKAARSRTNGRRAIQPHPPPWRFLRSAVIDLHHQRLQMHGICMTARILIIEDEEPLTLLLRYNLEAEGYEVDTTARGDEGDLKLKESAPDLAVIDWMLPGLSGIELIRRLRTRPDTRQLPVIMLTARGEEGERVRGLATGADDYIVKPFSVPELLARIRALLRRVRPERVAEVLVAGDIELDREKKRVSRSGREVPLGPTEFRLLEFLMQSPGRVFSREQ